MTISRIPDRQATKSRFPSQDFGKSRFPGSSQIPNPVKIFFVFPNPAPYFGQIPDPENTLPDPGKGKVAHEPRRTTRPELIPVVCSMNQLRVLLPPPPPPLVGMLVHRRVTPSSMSPVPIYTPGWRETNVG